MRLRRGRGVRASDGHGLRLFIAAAADDEESARSRDRREPPHGRAYPGEPRRRAEIWTIRPPEEPLGAAVRAGAASGGRPAGGALQVRTATGGRAGLRALWASTC